MRVLIYACAVLMMAWPAERAFAETLEFGTAGNWSISVDPTINNSCFAFTTFVDGSAFRLGFDMRPDAGSPFFVILGNIKWKSIEYGKEYPIDLTFGNKPPWSGNATGFSFDPPQDQTWLRVGVGKDTGAEFLTEFMKQQFVTVKYSGKEILRLNLKDSYKAGLKLIECQKKASQSQTITDPFKSTSGRSSDPFQ